MELTYDVFRTALIVLQKNNAEDLYKTLDSLNNHLGVLGDTHAELMEKLKLSVVFYKRYENQMEWRKVGITSDRIQTWAPLLKEHQKANVFPDVKAATVQQISSARAELEYIDMSLSEIQMRLAERAREVKNIMAEIEETKIKMYIMETAIQVSGFLTARDYIVKEIAEYEFEKLYNQYMEEVEEDG